MSFNSNPPFNKAFKFRASTLKLVKFLGQGSLGLAVFLGFITMIVLGWIPIIGPFIAGLVAGLIARGGAGRGATAGFITGILGALIIAVVITFLGTAFLGGFGFFVGLGI